MSFTIPSYANRIPIALAHLNVDRMYTAINEHKCSQQHYYMYLKYISDNDHAPTSN